MKLNMIVVMTTWLPRLACSQAGISAQRAPASAAIIVASGRLIHQGKTESKARQAMATPRPPT